MWKPCQAQVFQIMLHRLDKKMLKLFSKHFCKHRKYNKKGKHMGKPEVVAEQKAAVLAGQDAALEAGLAACVDAGVALGGGGGLSQADVDAAVKAAVDPLNAQLASVQSALDAETVKDQGDVALAASLQSKLDQIKAVLGL